MKDNYKKIISKVGEESSLKFQIFEFWRKREKRGWGLNRIIGENNRPEWPDGSLEMAKKLDLTGLSTEEIAQINSGISGPRLKWTVLYQF